MWLCLADCEDGGFSYPVAMTHQGQWSQCLHPLKSKEHLPYAASLMGSDICSDACDN